jgi:MarR family transcriptional regulator, 2-MHQ and catechol-resistance regulon repressor
MHDSSQRARVMARCGSRVLAILCFAMSADPISTNAEQAAALKLWVVLSRAHETVAELAKRDVERGELSLTEFGLMEALLHKGDLTAGEVSKRVLLRSGSLTYVIDKLVERDLIRRKICDEDKRRTYLQLTTSGSALMRRIWPGHAAAIERATSGLTLAEKRTVSRLLKKMGLHAEAAEGTGTKFA